MFITLNRSDWDRSREYIARDALPEGVSHAVTLDRELIGTVTTVANDKPFFDGFEIYWVADINGSHWITLIDAIAEVLIQHHHLEGDEAVEAARRDAARSYACAVPAGTDTHESARLA